MSPEEGEDSFTIHYEFTILEMGLASGGLDP